MALKIELLDEKKTAEPVLSLFLVEDTSGVIVRGKDHLGRVFSICRISERGLYLFDGIPADTGWPVDSNGKFKLVN